MRVLHTADWHLGRTFHGASLLDAQSAAAEHALAVARDEHVDAIVLAGDVYDRSMPPREAVQLWDESLTQMAEICPVIVISGNHDSPTRLGYGSGLFDRAGVHVRTRPDDCGRPIQVADGLVYAIPYLEPDLVRTSLGLDERSHEAVLNAAMKQVKADLRRRSAAPSVVTAHAFVAGVQPSASERDLTVGGTAVVPASTFAGVDYVALGHIHGSQTAGDSARYAGSPVAFSFSETGQEKSVAVVDVSAGEQPEVALHPVPVHRALARITGTLEELLTEARFTGDEQSWVQATITDAIRPRDAMARLQKRFPYAAELSFTPEGAEHSPTSTYAARVTGLSDLDLLERFVKDLRGVPPTEDEAAVLSDALTATRARETIA